MSEHDIHLVSLLLSVFAIILAPVLKAAGKGEIKGLIEDHNSNKNAHPNLDHVDKLQSAIEQLADYTREQFVALRKEFSDLRVEIARKRGDE